MKVCLKGIFLLQSIRIFINKKKTATFITVLAPRVRLELTTHWLTASCSTNWANEECIYLFSFKLILIDFLQSEQLRCSYASLRILNVVRLILRLQPQHLPTELTRNIYNKKLATSYFPNKVTRKYLRH